MNAIDHVALGEAAHAAGRREVTIDSHAINFGPQHPAAHGVLRLVLEMDGEIVERADPHVGLLHRGTEKLIESRTYTQNTPYFDRLDYVSPMCMEHAFVLATERLLGIEAPERAQWIRTLFDEITRVLNHLLNLTSFAMDVGALTPPLWAYEEREKLMEFYEQASGARLHANYYRHGGGQPRSAGGADRQDLGVDGGVSVLHRRFVEFADGQPDLEAAHGRYRDHERGAGAGLGFYRTQSARQRRAVGFAQGAAPTRCTTGVQFDVPVARNGDCYDRYLVRMIELRESVKIIRQCLEQMKPGPVKIADRINREAIAVQPGSPVKLAYDALINTERVWKLE